MTKILATALVALTATVMVVSTASAFPMIKLPPLKGSAPKGEMTSPGDAFQPFQQTADIRELCYERGGELKKVFDGTDFVWTCIV